MIFPVLRSGKVQNFSVCFLLLLTTILTIPDVQAAYEESIREGIFLVEPENQYRVERTVPTYLSSEDLTFFACIEYDDIPIRLSLLCSDDNNFIDISAIKWGTENCFMGSVDLDQLKCSDAVLVADYVRNGENQRLTKSIRINRVTGSLQRLLAAQYIDGGWSSALDTAYALFSLKPFEDVFTDRILQGLQYLKENRDETQKCWPEAQCQISTTASVAYLLAQSEYSDESRILRDATTYLTKTMSYISSGETYSIEVADYIGNQNNTINTSCVFAYGAANESIVMPRYPRYINRTKTPAYGTVVNVVCTENIVATIVSNVRGRIIGYAGDNFTYSIPGPCWTYNNENVTCDVRATAFAAGAPIDSARASAASEFLSRRFSTSVLGDELADKDIMTAAVIAAGSSTVGVTTVQRTRILNNLLYRQTNDGSWNATSMYYNNTTYYEPTTEYVLNFSHVLADNVTKSIVYTGFTVQALLQNDYTREDEPVLDAERWLSTNEQAVMLELDEESAQDAEIVLEYNENRSEITKEAKRNAMELYVLQQNTRPFLKSSPRVVVLDRSEITVDLTNPTTFLLEDLTYDLPTNLVPYVVIEEKDTFAPYSFRRITFQQRGNVSTSEFGYLRIKSGADEYAKIPLLVTSAPSINITFPSTFTVFGASSILPLNVTKSSHNFSCTMKWSDGGITSISSFSIARGGVFSLPIQFTKLGTEEKTYSGTVSCTAVSSTFTFPFSVLIDRFISKPFTVSPSFVSINESGQTGFFTVTNLLDESIDLTLQLRDPTNQLDISDFFLSLYPGESHNVTLSVIAPVSENVSAVNSILVRAFNVEERVAVTAEVIVVPERVWPLWVRIAVPVFGFGIVAVIGYFVYENRKKLRAWYAKRFSKQDTYAEIKQSVENYEKKEAALAIKNMTTILKMQGVSDKDIRSRLYEAGFIEEEIIASLKFKAETAPVPAAQQPPAGPGGAQRK